MDLHTKDATSHTHHASASISDHTHAWMMMRVQFRGHGLSAAGVVHNGYRHIPGWGMSAQRTDEAVF